MEPAELIMQNLAVTLATSYRGLGEIFSPQGYYHSAFGPAGTHFPTNFFADIRGTFLCLGKYRQRMCVSGGDEKL